VRRMSVDVHPPAHVADECVIVHRVERGSPYDDRGADADAGAAATGQRATRTRPRRRRRRQMPDDVRVNPREPAHRAGCAAGGQWGRPWKCCCWCTWSYGVKRKIHSIVELYHTADQLHCPRIHHTPQELPVRMCRRPCFGLLLTALLAWEPLLAEARGHAASPAAEPELPPVSSGRFRDKSGEPGSKEYKGASGKRGGRKNGSTDSSAPSLFNPFGKRKTADPEASEAAPSGRKSRRSKGDHADTSADGALNQKERDDEPVEDESKASGDALAGDASGKKTKKRHKKGLAGFMQTVRDDLEAVGLVGAPHSLQHWHASAVRSSARSGR
jgi:hypothetical protein